MKPRILRAAPLFFFASLALAAGCDQIGRPSEAETGATKIAQAAAEARAVTQRIASSPEAVGTTIAEEGASRDARKPMLAPSEAAKELRDIANKMQGIKSTDQQRKEAATLAQRLRREAAMLDLMALERIESRMRALSSAIVADLAAAQLIGASAGPKALAAAEARVRVTREELAKFQGSLDTRKAETEVKTRELTREETAARDATARADEVDAAAQVLRSVAATSAPSAAGPKIQEAVARGTEERALRKDAAEHEKVATVLRGEVMVRKAAAQGGAEGQAWLAGRLVEAEKAKTTATAFTQKAAGTVSELQAHATTLMEELSKLTKDEFKPLWDTTKEAFDSNLATKTPTDAAALAVCKARVYVLAANAAQQAVRVGTFAGAAGTPEIGALQADQDRLLGQAKAALVEARDALGGTSSTSAQALLASVQEMAQALGADLSQPAPAAAPAAGAAPAEAAAETSGGASPTAAGGEETAAAKPPVTPPPPSEPAPAPEPEDPSK